MNNFDKISNLVSACQNEIARAVPGKTDGQFPILDLLGNIRDEAQKMPEAGAIRGAAAEGWEHLVNLVESAKPFQAAEIAWFQELGRRLAQMIPPAEATQASPAAEVVATPPPAPVIALAPVPDPELLVLNLGEDTDLLREFLNESREHLDNIEQGVLVLETHPSDAETLATIFRAFHTFKGGAGFLNLIPINRLAHKLETLLDLVRQHKLVADKPVIDLILRGRDLLKLFLDAIERQLSGAHPPAPIHINTTVLKAEVDKLIDRTEDAPQSNCPPPVPAPEIAAATIEPLPAAPLPAAPAPVVPEAPVARTSDSSSAVRVETEKLDALLNIIGEMVISQSMVGPALNRLSEQDPQFARNVAHLSRITKELQRVGMSMRMVPIRGLFQKMTRVVRDLSAKQNKRIQLITSGEDTELDRSVVEELNDPLLHMIRNSVDHGIESAEARVKAGKSAVGTLHLRAFHQGGNIAIEIADDGAGLNRDRIFSKAVERGLASPSAQMADEDVFRFIFAPGFSTADKVTDISGRGVGLDVVRRNVEALRGCVDIDSILGRGARFKITLPLTLAIIDGLVVRVGEERYIIPTLSVRESFRPRPEMINCIQNGEVVDVRGRLIPLLRLHRHFGLRPLSEDPTQGIVIVAQAGSNLRCLLVDRLESKQEVVIKNLNDIVNQRHHSLAGAAILGDGRVGLILDVSALVQSDQQLFAKAA